MFKVLLVAAGLLLQRPTFATGTDTGVRPSTSTPSPLHVAVRSGDLEEVRRLLDRGSQVDAADDQGRTPLHAAVISGRVEIAALLLDRGADPNARAAVQMTPLHFAAMLGRPELAGLLVRRGARTDVRNEGGETPLHLAANDKTVHVLANAGASLTARDRHGETPLHTARQSSVARALLDHGADMRIRNARGQTAMELAAVESLESVGLSIRSVMLGRLRGLIGAMPLTLTNISSAPIRDLAFAMQSPACEADASPDHTDTLLPGQAADIIVSFTRNPTAPEGEHPLYVTVTSGGRDLGKFDLRIDTRMRETPTDRGMIRLAKGQMRPAPSRWYYLVYGAAPLLVVALWLWLRRR